MNRLQSPKVNCPKAKHHTAPKLHGLVRYSIVFSFCLLNTRFRGSPQKIIIRHSILGRRKYISTSIMVDLITRRAMCTIPIKEVDQMQPLTITSLCSNLIVWKSNQSSENLTSKALILRHHRLHAHGHLLDAYNDVRFACMCFSYAMADENSHNACGSAMP
jgi:hypothetical protein